MKRAFDILGSLLGILILGPVALLAALFVYILDRHSPVHISKRLGKSKRVFEMYKIRSMIPDAEKSGVESTASDDLRITKFGRWLRLVKLDEVPQLWNVLKGNMSLVGPRPNVVSQLKYYQEEDQRLFSVLPGVTDLASIVFSNEGELLSGSKDPHHEYLTNILPIKKWLALFYIDHQSPALDLIICFLTVWSFLNRQQALAGVRSIVRLYSKEGCDLLIPGNDVRKDFRVIRQSVL